MDWNSVLLLSIGFWIGYAIYYVYDVVVKYQKHLDGLILSVLLLSGASKSRDIWMAINLIERPHGRPISPLTIAIRLALLVKRGLVVAVPPLSETNAEYRLYDLKGTEDDA